MNGAGFGAFMSGLSGGMSAGKGIKDMMVAPAAKLGEAGSKASGYSGDLSKFEPGKPGAAEAAAPQAGNGGIWGALSSVLGSLQSAKGDGDV